MIVDALSLSLSLSLSLLQNSDMEPEMGANPSSPSSPKSKARTPIFRFHPSQTHQFPFTPLIVFLTFALTVTTTTSNPSQFSQISYSEHCNDVVPESPPTTTSKIADFELLQVYNAYVAGGDKILGPQFAPSSPKTVSFVIRKVYDTDSKGVLKLDGTMVFRSSRVFGFPVNSTHRRLRLIHVRPPRIPVRMGESRFRLHGFWSSSSGKLCMVGSGLSDLSSINVVLKLNYPNSSTIVTSLVNGTLQSLDSSNSLNSYEPISILGISMMSYEYTLIDKENINRGFSDMCWVIRSAGRFDLEYMDDCNTVECNPLGGGSKILPEFMSFEEIKCLDNGRVRYLLNFSNYSYNGHLLSFDPNRTLVSEGVWDEKKKHLNLVACRVNITDSVAKGSVGDCSIMLSLSLLETLSLRNRSVLVGQMWSNRSMNDSSYFGRVALRSFANRNMRFEGHRYEYTEIDRVRKTCSKKISVKAKGGTYPNGHSSDMAVDMKLVNKKGQVSWGYISPLFVGNEFYKPIYALEFSVQVNNSQERVLNMSYELSFRVSSEFKLGGEVSATKMIDISAEGMYDTKTGVLCMIGCRRLGSLDKGLMKNESHDCEILVLVQYSPLNAKDGSHIKGTIESTRSKTDPLYFDRLELSSNSIYTRQAKESLWRMDLEITMVLISNTLVCIFVGMQLLHVKTHRETLPSISVVMVIVLTLGLVIPLVLNFEALFLANRYRQNVFLGSGGWIEVNEVLTRVITMIAFLLEFRLLQLTWSAKLGDESPKNLLVSDKKVLYLTVPLYIGGALVAWFAHQWKYSHTSPFLKSRRFGYQKPSLWGDLKSYAGLVLDGFLLPQVVFNLFCDSREMALTPLFYVGTTAVRLLPHAYDLYRAHSSTWYFNNIFANPRMDYYSTSWDIIISCAGVVLVFLIWLQQKFGGRCVLPKRFRESSVYEKVPVVNRDDIG